MKKYADLVHIILLIIALLLIIMGINGVSFYFFLHVKINYVNVVSY